MIGGAESVAQRVEEPLRRADVAIQSHGVLLALSEHDLIVRHASANTLELLGVAHGELLGGDLTKLFDDDSFALLREVNKSPSLRELNPLKLRLRHDGTLYDGTLQRSQGLLLLELERATGRSEASFVQSYRRVRNAVGRLRETHTVLELAELAAQEFRELTGFERVFVCRFTHDGSAQVIAEAGGEPFAPLLGSVCPGAQLSAAARERWVKHWLRVVVDAAQPVVAVESQREFAGEPLDLSPCVLRGVSPRKREHLANLGVRAAMTISLVVDGRLWGLMVCHHGTPRTVPYQARAAAEFLGEALSWRLAARERSDAFERQARAQALLARLVEQMSMHANPVDGLGSSERALLDLVGASGAVMCHERKRVALGLTPPAEQLDAFMRWLSTRARADGRPGAFVTTDLARDHADAPPLEGVAGVLAVGVAPDEHEYLLWFRARGDTAALAWESWQGEIAGELRNVILGGIQRRAAELARLNEELRESNLAKDEFLATVSHELRTPLNAMLGWLHLLQGGQLSEAKRAQAMDVIARNARTQAQLVEDLLDVSRITSGKLRLELSPIDPVAVLEAAVDAVRPTAETKGIAVELELDATSGPIAADAQRLQQVVWNLLTNAVKFSQRNGHIRVALRRLDGHVDIVVQDDGAGIRADFLPHVFERFRQAEGSTRRTHKGLGLGLAIVKHLVELHGGQVSAASEGEGRGATFTVRLPVATASQPVAPLVRTTQPQVPVTAAPQLAGLRVLVVDDEPDATDFLRALLQSSGVAVSTAQSGYEALELLAAAPHDILVSDVGMPGMDGFDLIRRVRALPPERGGRIRAVALTAFTRTQDRARAFLAGFDVYLPKPVDAGELVALLGSLAERLNARAEAGTAQREAALRMNGERGALRPIEGSRLLVVDNDPERGQHLAAVLRGAGAEVRRAETAASARALVRSFRPDLLVCDVALPDQDGYALLRGLRSSGAGDGGWIPAVAISQEPSPDDAKKALLAGYQLHLARPLDLDTLVARIAKLVGWSLRRG